MEIKGFSTSTQTIAATTNGTAQALEKAHGFAAVTAVTVSTPAADTFADGDIDTTTDAITLTAHGMATGLKGQVSNSGGALPTGISAATDYFIIAVDANTVKLASSLSNAQAGTAVNITAAAGGGTHTFTPTALAGASVKLQASLDGTTWVDVASSSNNITVSADFMWNVDAAYYTYVRMVHTLTAGQLTTTSKFAIKG